MCPPFSENLLIPLLMILCLIITITADSQINLLGFGCSNRKSTDPSLFLANLNSTINELKSQIYTSEDRILFATAERSNSTAPVFALAFCRGFLSRQDCLTCITSASSRVRICGPETAGIVVYDGCTVRYESKPLPDRSSPPVNNLVCSNETADVDGFADSARGLLRGLSLMAPQISWYFAAAEYGGVYAAAQCSPTASEAVCSLCLQVAYANIKGCLASTDGRVIDAVCFMRYSNEAFFSANYAVDLTAYFPPGGRGENKAAIIGGVAGGICLLLLLVLGIVVFFRRLRRSDERLIGDISRAADFRGPVNFLYNDLKSATNNFSEDNKLGEGGFGEVYKGIQKNGEIIAVKKLAVTQSKRAKACFLSEVNLISNARHQNLLRYLGCSSNSGEMLLVYEYMANGSLDKFIFGEMHGMLNWKQRFDIIVGMARGLAYLHQEFHVCIIHRDIKSSNVLLDDNFRAKIADFGLARLRPGDQSHLSSYFSGTLGYIAPEYIIHGNLTEKVDTFSFGVVVLEILSGQRNCDSKLELEPQYLLESAWKLYEENNLLKLIDKSLDPNEYSLEEVLRVITIALHCTQEVSSRPNMSQVVVLLLGQGGPQIELKRPPFVMTPGKDCHTAFSSTASPSRSRTKHFLSNLIAR